ncbi:hypothetical protein [Synechococcus sp. HK01-R]|uniref:hypothetical protein n=1 Tax=Synechococcus sp. HK01-R TaxID=2751171 RepID=UPI0016264D47|nr:hypothetical protein [Synechococcus sp. HK01-R]QNG27752.1 hypothetical protein H0O21_03965 [Synechococcus sp. HK01-R]
MRLKLHVGHGKTGSSYLQSWLAVNGERLKVDHDVLYPQQCPLTNWLDQRAGLGQFSMGNGYVLDSVLAEDCGPRRCRRWWRRLLRQSGASAGDLHAVLFSCEPWARRLPDRFPKLNQLLSVLDLDGADLWLLVRDPLDHAISVYGQMVKRHGFQGDLEDWLSVYDFPQVLLRFLERRAEQGDRITLQVDHYGRQRANLVSCLLGWLGLPLDAGWSRPVQSSVNRSLTRQELALIRWLNGVNAQLSVDVAERLVNQLPQLHDRAPVPSQAACEGFVQRWQPVVRQINGMLPDQAQLQLKVPELAPSGEQAMPSPWIGLSREQLSCLLESCGALG